MIYYVHLDVIHPDAEEMKNRSTYLSAGIFWLALCAGCAALFSLPLWKAAASWPSLFLCFLLGAVVLVSNIFLAALPKANHAANGLAVRFLFAICCGFLLLTMCFSSDV